ncbi:MAG: dephospho-CoA kinase [Oscillospiraceae bacterium]
MSMLIGLTGQTGAGKTLAGDFFKNYGFAVIDCDLVSRQVVNDGSNCIVELVKEFSPAILNPDATLNRKELGKIVFADKIKLKRLDEIIFPYITRRISTSISALELGYDVIILDAPTLFESGIDKMCDVIISVLAPEEIRLNRIISRDNISKEEAKARSSSQLSNDFYKEKSDFAIVNDGNISLFQKELLHICSVVENFSKSNR